jgi:N-acetyl-alpha-D-muramate 1-phosphate uridylyltransferase
MPAELAALILAAGAGTRLRPLTNVRPKALCPVNNVPLVDAAIAIASEHSDGIAVNVHHGRDQMVEHLTGRVHLSIEERAGLGSAGAVGAAREWIDGRNLLVVNADRWHEDDLRRLVEGWSGTTARLLCIRDSEHADFDGMRFAGASLLPWQVARTLAAEPSGLRERAWDPLRAEGRLEIVISDVPFYDCGTPADYHRANMAASRGRNVIGEGATVEGEIVRCVLWPGVRVEARERLSDAIRAADEITVFV